MPQADVPAALAGGDPETCGVVAEIAVETDWELTEGFSGDTEASEAYALSLIAAVSEIYDRDAGASLTVSFLRVWADPDDLWTESGTSAQLTQFREYWNDNMPYADVPRHTAHFLSGRQLEGAGGVAYLPGLCQGPWAYGLSAHLSGSFPYPLIDNDPGNWDLVVVAHELGHNFGTGHTHDGYCPPLDQCYTNCSGPTICSQGTLMSYCHLCAGGMNNINLEFHPIVSNQMRSEVDSSCLTQSGLPSLDFVNYLIRFNPSTGTGAKAASLRFAHDAPNTATPFVIGLTGTSTP